MNYSRFTTDFIHQFRSRSGLEYNPTLAGALPSERPHVRATADQPREDTTSMVPNSYAGKYLNHRLLSRSLLRIVLVNALRGVELVVKSN